MPDPGRPLSVGAQQTDIFETPARWRAVFERQQHFVCPGLIDPTFLLSLIERCNAASFVPERVIGRSEVETPPRTGLMLGLILSRSPLLRWMEAATGCGPLARCVGRVDRMQAGQKHRIPWHDDHNDYDDSLPTRALAIVINLSAASFGGGEFQLRRKGETPLLADFRHEHDGTAIVFSVDRTLEHRVRPLTAGGPRRVFAGWFSAAQGDP